MKSRISMKRGKSGVGKKSVSIALVLSMIISVLVFPAKAEEGLKASDYIKNVMLESVYDEEGDNPNNEFRITFGYADSQAAYNGVGFAVVSANEDIDYVLSKMIEDGFISSYPRAAAKTTNENGIVPYDTDGFEFGQDDFVVDYYDYVNAEDQDGDMAIYARRIVGGQDVDDEISMTNTTAAFHLPEMDWISDEDGNLIPETENLAVIYWTFSAINNEKTSVECYAKDFQLLPDGVMSVQRAQCDLRLYPNYDNLPAVVRQTFVGEYEFGYLRDRYFGTAPEREGYVLTGWAQYPNGDGMYSDTDTINLTESGRAFYAQWKEYIPPKKLQRSNFEYTFSPETYLYYTGEAQYPVVNVVPGGDITDEDIDDVKAAMILRCDGNDLGKEEGEPVTEAIYADGKRYDLYVDIPESDKFERFTAALGQFWINPADYKIDEADLVKEVKIGTEIKGFNFEVVAKDVAGNDVKGTVTITSDHPDVNTVAGSDYEGLSWSFTPELEEGQEADTNYNVPTTGDNAVLKTKPKTIITARINLPSDPVTYGDTYDENGNYCVSLDIDNNTDNLQEGVHYRLLYAEFINPTYTTERPKNQGTYNVKVEWIDDWGDFYEFSRDSVTETDFIYDNKGLVIKKRTLTVTYPEFTKEYDGTDTVYTKYVKYGDAGNKQFTRDDLNISNFAFDDTLEWGNDGFNAYYLEKDSSDDPIQIAIEYLSLARSLRANYDLPTITDAQGEKILVTTGMITKKKATATLKEEYNSKVYGTTKTLHLNTIQFDFDGLLRGDVVDTYEVTSEGLEETADVNKEEGYKININPPAEGGNYEFETDSRIYVTEANYTAPPMDYLNGYRVSGSIPLGQEIKGTPISGSVTNVFGRSVSGNFIITSEDKGTAKAGEEYTNLDWEFEPNTPDKNYNTLTGNGARLVPEAKELIPSEKITITVPSEAVYDNTEKEASASIEGFEDSDFHIEYSKRNTTGNYVKINEIPKDAGSYRATVVLDGETDAEYAVADAYKTYSIAKRKVTIKFHEGITKPYDQTATVKIDGSDMTLQDLDLNNRAEGDDEEDICLNIANGQSFSAAYTDVNAGNNIYISVNNVVLGGKKADNYTIDYGPYVTTGAITPKEITATVNSEKLSKTYGDDTLTLSYTDLTPTGLIGDDTLEGYTVTSGATERTAPVKTDGTQYGITITTPDDGNYAVTTDDVITVNPAQYKPQDEISSAIPAGEGINGFKIKGVVKDIDDNEVAGYYVIDEPNKGNAVENEPYNGLAWTFDADGTADTNYTILTSELANKTASLTTSPKIEKAAVITMANTFVYDKTAKEAESVAIDGLTESDFDIVYSQKNGDGTYTKLDSAPVKVGEYKVTAVLKGNADERYSLTADSKEFAITVKPLTMVYPQNVTKPYDGTRNVNVTVADFNLDGVINGDKVSLDKTAPLAASYADENYSASPINISLSGFKLTGDDAANYKLPETFGMTGAITRKEITATVNSEKLVTTYGNPAFTLDYTDLTTDGLIGGDTLEGYTVTSGGTASRADAKQHEITITTPADGNYTVTTEDVITVNPAQYTPQEKITGTITAGTGLKDYSITGTAEDIDGNSIPGKYVVTNADKGTAAAGTIYNDLSWKFVPNTADANYAELTGSGMSLTGTSASSGGGGGSRSRATPTPKPTATPEPTETPEPTATPEPTETPEPTATPSESGAVIKRDFTEAYASGYEDGEFLPDAPITRAELAAMISRLAGYDGEEYDREEDFADVSADMWYAKYISFLEKLDIMTGYEDGTFRPDENVTRAEISAVIARAQRMELIEGESDFTDVPEDNWACRFVNTLSEAGIVTGYEDGTFRPDSNVTRAETTAIVAKILPPSEPIIEFIPTDIAGHWAEEMILLAVNDRIIE